MFGDVIPGNDRIPQSEPKNLRDKGSQVSARFQLSQLSTLQRRHCSLTWPFAKMETVKRMLLSQWSLLDICICACLLGTDDWYELDSCTNVPSFDGQHQQGIERREGMAKARKSYLMFGDVIPGNDTFSEANQTNFVTKGLKFSSQHCKGDTTHWPDPLQKWKLWREWFSHSGHLLTPVSVLSVR